jgi:hypothetical protein
LDEKEEESEPLPSEIRQPVRYGEYWIEVPVDHGFFSIAKMANLSQYCTSFFVDKTLVFELLNHIILKYK